MTNSATKNGKSTLTPMWSSIKPGTILMTKVTPKKIENKINPSSKEAFLVCNLTKNVDF